MAGGSPAPGRGAATPNHRKRKAPPPAPAAAAAEDEAEAELEAVEELEREVADLDRRIIEHRRGTATRLLDAVASHFAALRPPACPVLPSETSIADDDQGRAEKLEILKSKVEDNIAQLPKALERMNESITRCQKLKSLNMNIHPVFREKQ